MKRNDIYKYNGLKSPLWGALHSALFSPFSGSALAGGGQSWSLSSLFSGESGGAYDASDLSTLAQNSDGSGAVTNAGDRVGYIADISGNGLHLTQPTAGERGTLRVDEQGNHYVEFASGECVYSAASFTMSVPCWVIAAFAITGTSSDPLVFGARKAGNQSFGVSSSIYSRVLVGTADAAEGREETSTALGSVTQGLVVVVDGVASDGTQTAGVSGGTLFSAANSLAGEFTMTDLRVGVNHMSTGVSGGTNTVGFYGGVMINKSPAAIERENATAYFKRKTSIAALESQSYDIFAIAGQSNATGQGDSDTSTAVPWGEGVEYQDGFIKQLADPTRHYATTSAGNVSTTGSAWPAFATKYFDLTGRRVCIVGGGASGVGLTTALGWNPSAVWRDALAAKTLAAKAFIESKGGVGNFRGVIWLGGETDATSSVSEATFETGLSSLLTNLRTAFSDSELRIFLMSVDQSTDAGQDSAFAAIRQAMIDSAASVEGLDLVMPYQEFEVNAQLEDSIHWNQTALNAAGEIAATNIAALLL